MAPNKQWMELINDRLADAYVDGVEIFLDYAFTRLGEPQLIRCPYIKCGNATSRTRVVVRSHLIVHGIIPGYTFWYHHGERSGEAQPDSEFINENDIEEGDGEDEIHGILRDLYYNGDNMNNNDEEEPNLEAKRFYKLLEDFELPLYESAKVSKLSTLVKLLHIKSIGHWSNESFTMLLKFLIEDLLLDGTNLPNSYYEAKKVIRDLGLSYKKIDACKNDCMLYWKDDNCLESCKVCGASGWKEDKHSGETKFKKWKKDTIQDFTLFSSKAQTSKIIYVLKDISSYIMAS
ncbi:uncharacterized protein LOC132037582 [Lycium ferocissimum]|uniref:uncharacterized protein LOC132037582 n=1 Tax=Lycium ferocissimum TaxID=112874 RepID=UPI002814B48B|nr:uncharacterized protein LOC132037582 [Lycium ferocissimum]